MPDLKIKCLKIKPEDRSTSRLVAEKGRARLGLDRLVRGKRGQSEARARSGRAERSRAFLTLHELGELKRSGSRRPLGHGFLAGYPGNVHVSSASTNAKTLTCVFIDLQTGGSRNAFN